MGSTEDLLPSIDIDPKMCRDQRRLLPPRNRGHDHMASAFSSSAERLMRESPELLPNLVKMSLSCGSDVDVLAVVDVE